MTYTNFNAKKIKFKGLHQSGLYRGYIGGKSREYRENIESATPPRGTTQRKRCDLIEFYLKACVCHFFSLPLPPI